MKKILGKTEVRNGPTGDLKVFITQRGKENPQWLKPEHKKANTEQVSIFFNKNHQSLALIVRYNN